MDTLEMLGMEAMGGETSNDLYAEKGRVSFK